MIFRSVLKAAALAGALVLAACGGGPSDSDVENALREQISQAMAQQRQMTGALTGVMGGQASKSIEDMNRQAEEAAANMKLTVESKTELDDGTYSAVVTAEANGQKQTQTVKLAETKDGWKIIQ